MSEVLVITSGSCGTGKTTLCAGLASCLAALGQNVLAVDCSIGRSALDSALGMKDCPSVTFLDVMMENRWLSDAPKHPAIPGLQLLTAPIKTRAGLVDDIIFRQLIEEAAETYDWVLLDAPERGFCFDLAVSCASRAILTANADAASLQAAEQTASALQGPDPVQLVINRVSHRRRRSVWNNPRESAGPLSLLGTLPEDDAVPAAASDGTALILRSRKGAALACLKISRRLLGLDAPQHDP